MSRSEHTRGLTVAVRAVVLAAGLFLVAAACGRPATPEAAVGESPAPGSLLAAFEACMASAGFPEAESSPLGGAAGQPPSTDQRYLDANLRCQQESGLAAYAPESDVEAEDPQAASDRTLRLVGCLEGRGWAMPEPTRSEGGLVPRFPQFATGEEQATFAVDLNSCLVEAGIGGEGNGGDGDRREAGGEDDPAHEGAAPERSPS